MRRLVTFLIFVVSSPIWSAEILRVGATQKIIAITHDPDRRWQNNDEACVIHEGQEVACGTVVKSTTKGAIVKLDVANNSLARGDFVRPPGGGSRGGGSDSRRPAAAQLLNSVDKDPNATVHRFNFAGGVNLGFSFFIPKLEFDFAFAPNFSFGIMPTFFHAKSGETTLTGYGGLGTLSYYGSEYFRGLWAQAAGGLFRLKASNPTIEESASSLVVLGTLGWRGYWDLGLNVGVAAGVQYTIDPNFQATEIRSTGLQPLLILDVGVNF